MKLPLIKVPDFRDEVEKEDKPVFYDALSKRDKEQYLRNSVNQRAVLWACKTAACAYNLGLLIIAVLITTNGPQLLKMLQKVIASSFGITQ